MQMTDAEKQELKQIHEAIKNHLVKIGGRLYNSSMTAEERKIFKQTKDCLLHSRLGKRLFLGKSILSWKNTLKSITFSQKVYRTLSGETNRRFFYVERDFADKYSRHKNSRGDKHA